MEAINDGLACSGCGTPDLTCGQMFAGDRESCCMHCDHPPSTQLTRLREEDADGNG